MTNENDVLDSVYVELCTIESLTAPCFEGAFENTFEGLFKGMTFAEREAEAYRWLEEYFKTLYGVMFAIDTLATTAREQLEKLQVQRFTERKKTQ